MEVKEMMSLVDMHREDLHGPEGEVSEPKSDKDAMLERLLKEKEALAQKVLELEAKESEQSTHYHRMRNRLRKRIKVLESDNSALRKEVALLNRLTSNDSLTTLNRSLQNEVTRLTVENLVSSLKFTNAAFRF